MKTGKRIVTLLLLSVMLFSLAACSGPAGTQNSPPQESLGEENARTLRRDKMTQEEADAVPEQSRLTTISTACGEITGIQREGYTEWRGIRYATAERFEEPVQVSGWEGTYDATVWGPRANQYYGFYNMADSNVSQFYIDESTFQWSASYSEDCLNLNIWAPEGAKDCPVLVYIHGGSFLTGSNTDASTDGEAFARNGVVTVAINYRLGPFHQVYGDGYTGDLALLDQVAALHWVRDNIGDYGGDGSRITVMGESAGAVSVQNLLASPLVEKGLISGAVMMSGGGDLSSIGTPTTPGAIEGAWTQVKSQLNAATIGDLKSVDAKELYATWLKSGGTTTPTVNGTALTGNIADALNNDTVQNVPVIIGMLSEDMWPYTLYNAAVDYAAKRTQEDGAPVYLYYFDRQIDKTFGAFHAGDLYYMFGTLYRNVREMDDVDYRISGDMIAYVSNFIKTGDPNSTGLTRWEAATGKEPLFMHFGDEEAGMIAPDASLLANNQTTRPTFPYAATIKVNQTQPPAGGEDGTAEPVKNVIAPEELVGNWTILGWNAQADGSFTAFEGGLFTFTENKVTYYLNGEVASESPFAWRDDFNIALNPDAEAPLIWTVYRDDKGQLMIEDPSFAIIYVCVPAGDGQPAESEKPAESEGPGQAGVVPADGTAVSEADLVGEWKILGWIVNADGSWAPIDPGQTYTFDGATMDYNTGADVVSTGYTFIDAYTISLTDWMLEWPLWLNEKGQLCILDSRYDITYVCEK